MVYIYLVVYLIVDSIYLYFFISQTLIRKYKEYSAKKVNVKDIEYYREELNEYSPLIEAKLMNIDIKRSDVITSMILYLESKNVLTVTDDKVIVNDDSDLTEHELFFVEKMKLIFMDLANHTNSKYYEDYTLIQYLDFLVKKDMVKLGLCQESVVNEHKTIVIGGNVDNTDSVNKVKETLLLALPFFYDMFNIAILSRFIDDINIFVYILFFVPNIITIIVYFIIYFKHLYSNNIKTEKGLEEMEKLNAQKKYLNTFSTISSKQIEDQSLWKSYIRNAILFDLKGKLDKESKDFYKSVITKYKYKESKSVKIETMLLSFVSIILLLPWVFFLVFFDNGMFRLMLSCFIVFPMVYKMLFDLAKK